MATRAHINLKVTWFVYLLAFACLGTLSAASSATETTLERIKRSGVVEVGYVEAEPFAFTTPGGFIDGESPQIARYVLRKIGVEIIPVAATYKSLISDLEAGRFDI